MQLLGWRRLSVSRARDITQHWYSPGVVDPANLPSLAMRMAALYEAPQMVHDHEHGEPCGDCMLISPPVDDTDGA